MKNKIIKITLLIYINLVLITLVTNIFAEQTTINPPLKAVSPIVQPPLPTLTLSTQTQTSYTIELQVSSDSEDERKQTFVKALDQLLTKNSGNPKITTLPTIKAALSNPSIYVERYTYATHGVTATAVGPQAIFLQIQFNQESVTQLLQQATQPEQKIDTQQILVWLVKVTEFGNKIMEDESSNDVIVPVLKKNAQDSSISIMLPISDLQDTNLIKTDDICNLNITAIKDASQRYGTQTVVAGCVKEPIKGRTWTSQWLLLRDNKSNNFSFSGTSAESVIAQAMSIIAPSTAADVAKKIILRVTNVNGLDQYNNVVGYLTALNQVAQVNLVKISPTEVELSVNTKAGGQEALIAAFNTQNKLVRNTTSPPPGIDLDYKYIPINKVTIGTGNEQPQAIGIKPLPKDAATFINFFVGANKQLVNVLSNLYANKEISFVYFWGNYSAGKSHLLSALCQSFYEHGLIAAYLSFEEIQQLDPQILEELEKLDLLCVDDLNLIAGNLVWEEKFFHCFNKIAEHGKKIVITANAAPQFLSLILPDLKSRMASGLIFELQPLNDIGKIQSLKLRAKLRGLELNDVVAQFLLHHYARDTKSLFATLDRLDKAALTAQRKLTIPFVKDVLG